VDAAPTIYQITRAARALGLLVLKLLVNRIAALDELARQGANMPQPGQVRVRAFVRRHTGLA
jgi:hypothetical protein